MRLKSDDMLIMPSSFVLFYFSESKKCIRDVNRIGFSFEYDLTQSHSNCSIDLRRGSKLETKKKDNKHFFFFCFIFNSFHATVCDWSLKLI